MKIALFLDAKALSMLPVLLESSSADEIISAAYFIADAFGNVQTFKKLIEGLPQEKTNYESKQLISFYNNLNLLVQKTWVEKTDEVLKEQVHFHLDVFKDDFTQQKYNLCYDNFLGLLRDVVYLMFGVQSTHDDFLDYALRIDPELGIFWWYFSSLPEKPQWTQEKTRIILLLGMIFIANY